MITQEKMNKNVFFVLKIMLLKNLFKPQRYMNKNRVRYRYLDNEVSLQQHFVKIFTPPMIKMNIPV